MLRLLVFVFILGVVSAISNGDEQQFVPNELPGKQDNGTGDGMERWGYVDVREGAHTFWWLYYTYHSETYLNRPWIIWLQGGPGSSSCGYGNFELIGPLNLTLDARTETWVNDVSVVFIDNPVGTGYSYVDGPQYYTTDNAQIALDLVEWIKVFLTNYPDFQTLPLYIFGESYGGKMGSEFAYELNNAIGRGEVTVDLRGVANGNAWLSPEDSVLEWGPHLHYMSNLDDAGLERLNNASQFTKDAIDAGNWQAATNRWGATELVVWEETNMVNFYNILKYDGDSLMHEHNKPPSKAHRDIVIDPILYNIHLAEFEADPLDELMNGEIMNKLYIIPENVTWGGQSDAVFSRLEVDFMKPVIDVLDQILAETNLQLTIYQGALDLICLTQGANRLVNKMTWADLPLFQESPKTPMTDPMRPGQTDMFIKAYNNFKFYWMINAGHMVPKDYPTAARRMLNRIVFDMD